jgi:hypothetical protein
MNSIKKNPWLQSGFLVAVAILSTSAVGLNSAIALLKLHMVKEAVPLKRDLSVIPEQMGDWLQVSKDEPLDHEMQDTLGTPMYVFRDYVNVKAVDSMDIARAGIRNFVVHTTVADALKELIQGLGSRERKAIVGAIQSVRPEAVLSLAVTYYTGKVDTVAHVPERCYVADGYQPTETPETALWDMGPARLNTVSSSDPRIAVRFINFEDQTGAKRITKRVAYFFFCDGVYESDPVSVRQTLGNLRSKHGFYSKVELMSIIPDHDQCAKVMSNFLVSAMPEIEKCLPDWNSVEHGSVKQ